jgi:5-methyltetrahydrofolate--homocysteine methyltransferase
VFDFRPSSVAHCLPAPQRSHHLLALPGAERIGITPSDEFQLHPEQSTSAIVCHHPSAKYFTL